MLLFEPNFLVLFYYKKLVKPSGIEPERQPSAFISSHKFWRLVAENGFINLASRQGFEPQLSVFLRTLYSKILRRLICCPYISEIFKFNGGAPQSRTGLRGFAIPCITDLLERHKKSPVFYDRAFEFIRTIII